MKSTFDLMVADQRKRRYADELQIIGLHETISVWDYSRASRYNEVDHRRAICGAYWHQRQVERKCYIGGRYCEICHRNEPEIDLHLHHRHYATLRHEILSDLVFLCAECHSYVHELIRLGCRGVYWRGTGFWHGCGGRCGECMVLPQVQVIGGLSSGLLDRPIWAADFVLAEKMRPDYGREIT